METATNAMYQAAEPKHKADVVPIRKNVTLPIDYDVLEWFETQDDQHPLKISQVLRNHMEQHKKDAKKDLASQDMNSRVHAT